MMEIFRPGLRIDSVFAWLCEWGLESLVDFLESLLDIHFFVIYKW